MLTRIFVDNFRALVNFEFRPQTLTLLLGENGSGKSSLFEALACLTDVVVRGFRVDDHFAFSRTAWDKRETQRFELDVVGPEGTYRYALVVRHPKDASQTPYIDSENVSINGAPLFEFSAGHVHLFDNDHAAGPVFPFRAEHSFLANQNARGSKIRWFMDFMAGFTVLQINPFDFGYSHSKEDSVLRRFGNNFSAFWDYLGDERPDLRQQCESQLQEAVIDYLAADSAFRFERPDGNVIVQPLQDIAGFDGDPPLKASEIIARGG